MTLMSQLEDLEAMIVKGRVPGTARTLGNLEKITAAITEMKSDMPTQMSEAEGVVRQKDAIIKQAELEARRIRAYADDEFFSLRSPGTRQRAAGRGSGSVQISCRLLSHSCES